MWIIISINKICTLKTGSDYIFYWLGWCSFFFGPNRVKNPKNFPACMIEFSNFVLWSKLQFSNHKSIMHTHGTSWFFDIIKIKKRVPSKSINHLIWGLIFVNHPFPQKNHLWRTQNLRWHLEKHWVQKQNIFWWWTAEIICTQP